MMEIICPVCNHDDAIQKVSIIVANGQSSGNNSGLAEGAANHFEYWDSVGGVTRISRRESIELARKLLPPIEPTIKGGIGCKGILAIVLVFILFAILIAFATIILRNLGHLINSSSSSSIILVGLIPIIFIVGSVISLFIILLIKGINLSRENYNASKVKEEEKYIQEKLRWDAAIDKWNCAYYCYRDGVVFDNKSITVCPLEQFREFLFS
jgi:hypothetical protein